MESATSLATPKKRRLWPKITTGIVFLIVLTLCGAWWVMFAMPGESFSGELPELAAAGEGKVAGPALAAELRRDVTKLAIEIGPRNLAHRANLVKAAEFVERELTAAGYRVQRQSYKVEGVDCWNLETAIRGSTKPSDLARVVIGLEGVIRDEVGMTEYSSNPKR